MWRDAKIVGDTEDSTVLAHMCKVFYVPSRSPDLNTCPVRAEQSKVDEHILDCS